MKTTTYWRRYAAFTALLGAINLGIEVPYHQWPQLGIAMTGVVLSAVYSRRGFKAAAEHEAHRPDYAKIARLEVELGLVPPPVPPESVPTVRVSDVASGPFIRKTQAGRYPSPQTREVMGRMSPPATTWDEYLREITRPGK